MITRILLVPLIIIVILMLFRVTVLAVMMAMIEYLSLCQLFLMVVVAHHHRHHHHQAQVCHASESEGQDNVKYFKIDRTFQTTTVHHRVMSLESLQKIFFRKSIPISHNHALFLGHQYQKNKNYFKIIFFAQDKKKETF